MKTKEKILSTALDLFNTEGLQKVTLRKIAGSMGISQGNLNYHYKTKGDIVAALYYQLVEEMDQEMKKVVKEQPVMSFLFESSLTSMRTLYAYRFISKDLYHVLQAEVELTKHYLKLQKLRRQQYLTLFHHMISEGLLRSEDFEGEYERLYERMNILGDNWINAAIFFAPKGQSMVEYYHKLLFEVIYPYLTKKGKKEFCEIG